MENIQIWLSWSTILLVVRLIVSRDALFSYFFLFFFFVHVVSDTATASCLASRLLWLMMQRLMSFGRFILSPIALMLGGHIN